MRTAPGWLSQTCFFCGAVRCAEQTCAMIELDQVKQMPNGCIIRDLHEPIPEKEEK